MLLTSVTNVLKMNSMHAFLLLCLEVELIIYMQDGTRKKKTSKTTDMWCLEKKHQSLVFDENDLMHCKLCVKWETKIASCGNFSLSFINGSSNYHLSNVESHFKSMMHLTAVEKEEQGQVEKLGAITNRKKNYCSKRCID